MGEHYSLADIDAFIRKQLGNRTHASSSDADLFEEFHITGDDCDEFMHRFGTTFGVDLSGFRWYFHYDGKVA